MLVTVSACVLLLVTTVAADSCIPPALHNGYVVGEGDDKFWTGALVCQPGFTLVGNSKLKCRNGQWSSNMPVCTAIGKCDPDNLPEIENGRKDPYKTTQYRGAVYKFSCARGYKRLGNSLVHCNGDHWDLQRVPICSRAGCDESLMSEIASGQSKRKAHGGVYFYKCEEGGVMQGSRVVVCNGRNWNDTAPICLNPTRHPLLSVEASTEIVAGSAVTIVCDADEGSPEPTLTLYKNNEQLGEPAGGHHTHTFVASQEDNTAVVSCSAINSAMSEHLTSEIVLNVKFGPSEVHIGGPDFLNAEQAGGYECASSSSNPPAEISWHVSDHNGDDAANLLQVSESSTAWSGSGWETSSTAILHPKSGVTVLHVSCTAANSVTTHQVTDQKQVALKFAPEKVTLSGPSKVLSGSDVLLECVGAPSVPAAALTWSVTQNEERLKFSPDETVEQLEDGSFVTRSMLSLVANKGHDLVVECYGTNEVMGNDYQAYAHVIEILSPPGVPKISGVSPNALVQNLTCSTSAGNPPASLSWYQGQEMMESHYLVEGDMVMAHITFVPNEHNREVTCEASNEALSEPIRNTVIIDVASETSSEKETTTTMLYEYDEYEEDEDDYSDEYMYEDSEKASNVTDIENYRLLDEEAESEHAVKLEKDTGVNEYAVHTEASDSELDNYSENEAAEIDAVDANHSVNSSEQKVSLIDKEFEKDTVNDRIEDYSETPTDAVFVPSQKQLANTHSLKSSVEVTEATKTKEKDKRKIENETSPLKASHTMSSANYTTFSLLNLFLTILIAKVIC